MVGLRNLFCLSEKQERSDPGEIFSGCGVQMRRLIGAVDAISAFFFAAVFWESVWVQRGARSSQSPEVRQSRLE